MVAAVKEHEPTGEFELKKKTVLTGFGTALSDAGALTLVMTDLEGRKSEIIVLPSMLPKIIEILIGAQKEAPDQIAIEKTPRNIKLSRAEQDLGREILDAQKKPDGWYGVVTRLDLNAAALLVRNEGHTTQLMFGPEDLLRLMGHLENALVALGGRPQTLQ